MTLEALDTSSIRSYTIGDVLDLLASARPDWGGGSAVLLGAAMGACLLAMSARVSLAGVEAGKFTPDLGVEELRALGDKLASQADSLAAWAALDGSLYGKVVAAQRLPKEDPERRQAAIEAALRGAIEGPLQVAELMVQVLELAQQLAPNCKKANLSDISSGVNLLRQGVRGALLNVRQNCGQREVFAMYRDRADALGKKCDALSEVVLAYC